jgi:hypothetical protein
LVVKSVAQREIGIHFLASALVDHQATASAASAICAIRMRLSGRIRHFRRADDLVAKMATEVIRRAKIDFPPADHRRQLECHRRKRQEPWNVLGREFDEQVYITVVARDALEDGTEYRQSANVDAADRMIEAPRLRRVVVMPWVVSLREQWRTSRATAALVNRRSDHRCRFQTSRSHLGRCS